MTPIVSIQATPCPDPECVDGMILVHNAYSEDPLKPEAQICDTCGGRGFLMCESITNN
jgi:hypothetical protein